MKFEPADEAIGEFALQTDETGGRMAIGDLVDEFAVEEDADGVARADDLHPVPFAEGILEVLGAAIALHISPVRIAVTPVDAGHRFSGFGKGFLGRALGPEGFIVAVALDLSGDLGRGDGAVFPFGRKHEDVAAATLDELALDAAHPGMAIGSIGSEGVEE